MSFSSSNRPPAAGARAAKSAGTARRLPGGRERRPALAALAVILILLGAAGSALIALRSGDRQYFVAVNKDLPPGYEIADKDLARGDLAGATRPLVLWSERDQLFGKYTTSWIYKGQFVTRSNFVPDPVPEGGALVGVSLESGRAPAEPIQDGDIVRLVRVPANQDSGPASVIAPAAEVTAVNGTSLTDGKTGANTTVNVTVLVPTDQSTAVAASAAAKTLVLVKLSAATKPEISTNRGAR
ncbi:hypothetical protein BWI15_09390 [Kribbella sp. ALI-6-A]|uniref:hypothetical protein n=1 Tax=Kribbella sp. ALI-6-A TaxID=1933817 RepID=UPI00097C2996|nr:hypothetical protein [Kribbella sp. ALI-6-A]ONI73641.1 hypothetical protein BWI15_09390 [Kribbella sp. ALI-6-A]